MADDPERIGDLIVRAEAAEAERDEARAALSALYEAGVQVVDVSNPNLAEERRKLSRLLDRYEREDHDWRKAVHAWIARAETAEARVAELEDLIRRTLDLRSTYDREQGRDVPLVNNWQARGLLERALKGDQHGRS